MSQPGEAARQRNERGRDRERLVDALRRARLWTGQGEPDLEALVVMVHRFLARTSAGLAMVQLEDIAAQVDPINIPGTSGEHPNWRRRLSLRLEELVTARRFLELTQVLRDERPPAEQVA